MDDWSREAMTFMLPGSSVTDLKTTYKSTTPQGSLALFFVFFFRLVDTHDTSFVGRRVIGKRHLFYLAV